MKLSFDKFLLPSETFAQQSFSAVHTELVDASPAENGKRFPGQGLRLNIILLL